MLTKDEFLDLIVEYGEAYSRYFEKGYYDLETKSLIEKYYEEITEKLNNAIDDLYKHIDT